MVIDGRKAKILIGQGAELPDRRLHGEGPLLHLRQQSLKRFTDLELIHVPGHAGVLLNERADKLAVQAVKSEETSGWVTYGEKPDA